MMKEKSEKITKIIFNYQKPRKNIKMRLAYT